MNTLKKLEIEWKELAKELDNQKNINTALVKKIEELEEAAQVAQGQFNDLKRDWHNLRTTISEWKETARAKGLDNKFGLLMRRK